jgi:hypothetical protein
LETLSILCFPIPLLSVFFAIYAVIDGRDLPDPPTPLTVFKIQNCVGLPVKVISDEGYLPVQQLEGVA